MPARFPNDAGLPADRPGQSPSPAQNPRTGHLPVPEERPPRAAAPTDDLRKPACFPPPAASDGLCSAPKFPPPLRSWPGRSRIRPPAVPFRCMVRTKLLFNPIVILAESWYIDCKVTAVHRPRGVASALIRHPLREILRIPSAPPAVDSDSKDKDKGESL